MEWFYLLEQVDKMRYAIFGDMHGTELKDLEIALSHENPDVLVCTGDFDQTRVVHQFIDLERAYKKLGKEVIRVPGNHDHAILTNLPIRSGTLRRQGRESWELHEDLMKDPVAKDYIDNLVNSRDSRYINNRVRIFLDEGRFGKEYQTIVIHGAYDGSLDSYPDCPPEIRDLWMRLRNKEDHKRNFEVMKKKGYKAMIRGHDHHPVYVYEDGQKGIVEYIPEPGNSAYSLFKHRTHTINPGALFDGIFAIIDTRVPGEEVPILRYVSL
jgi:predicted phosphodiesterase